jgi:threonine dehydrogenase-like Zn-dependent dehydrogenase
MFPSRDDFLPCSHLLPHVRLDIEQPIPTPAARSSILASKEAPMRGAVSHAPGDVRFENLDDPKILQSTDAVIRTVATCVCGSDLWPYRGIEPSDEPHPMGHEYVGIVEEVGSEVTSAKPGQFVVGSFATSDNACPNCQAGYRSSCVRREFMSTCQAEYVRVPNAHGTLVATPELPWSSAPPTSSPNAAKKASPASRS